MARPKERTEDDAKGLAPFGRALATAGAAMLTLGLAFGDYPYLIIAVMLLGLCYWARGHAVPGLSATRTLSRREVRAGDTVDVSVEVGNENEQPVGLSLHDKAPDAFSLEAGGNFGAGWLAPGQRATAYDPLFLQSAPVSEAAPADDVTVHPRTPPAPRIRTSAAWGRTLLPGG